MMWGRDAALQKKITGVKALDPGPVWVLLGRSQTRGGNGWILWQFIENKKLLYISLKSQNSGQKGEHG
ncbi:MAG: hypothetical protein HQL95_13960 [Magnetococcales bacterium]|nr:hypothetical protein [Magnetococcales bacterium]